MYIGTYVYNVYVYRENLGRTGGRRRTRKGGRRGEGVGKGGGRVVALLDGGQRALFLLLV